MLPFMKQNLMLAYNFFKQNAIKEIQRNKTSIIIIINMLIIIINNHFNSTATSYVSKIYNKKLQYNNCTFIMLIYILN